MLDLAEKIVEVEYGATLDLGGQCLGRPHIDARCDLLHQCQYVAHPQYAAGVALGVEYLQPVDFLAGARKFDGRARDVAYRQGGATSRVAVGLGQDNAGQRQSLLEGKGRVGSVLSLHRVDDEQRLDRGQRLMQLPNLTHQRLVNCQATSGINQ